MKCALSTIVLLTSLLAALPHGYLLQMQDALETVPEKVPDEHTAPYDASIQSSKRFRAFQAPEQKFSKYPVIAFCHIQLEKVFGKNSEDFWKDWKLWVGFMLWSVVSVRWMRNNMQENFYERFAFTFGVNILILHSLQYTSNVKMTLLGISVLLILQSLAINFIWYWDTRDDPEPEEFVCGTLYLNLELPLFQIFVVFVAQCSVWWFYMTSIIFNFDLHHVNYVYWMGAYLAMQMTMIFDRGSDSVFGEPFPTPDGVRLWHQAGKVIFEEQGDKAETTFSDTVPKWNMTIRFFTGFWTNAVLREIMAYTIPVMLMGFSEPMDFVVYCVGVNFITTVDDMAAKTYVIKPLADPEAGMGSPGSSRCNTIPASNGSPLF